MSSASHTHKVDTWFNNSLSNTTSWIEKMRSSSNQQQQQSSTKNKKKNTLSFATNKKNSKQQPQQSEEEEQKLNYIPVKRINFKFQSSSTTTNDESIAVDQDASSALARQALKCSDYYYSKDSSSLHHQNVSSLDKVCLVKTPSTEKEKGEVCIVNNNETDTEENGQKKGRTNQSSSFFISSALPRVVQTTTSIINQNNNDNNNSNNSIPVAKNPLFINLHRNRKRETDGAHHHYSATSTLQLLSSIQTALEWISGGNEFYEDFKKGFARDVLVKEAHYVLCRMKIKSRSRNKNKDTHNTFWTPVEHLIPELIAELKSKYGLTFLDLAGSDVTTMLKDDAGVDNDDDYSRTQRDAFSSFLIEAIRDHQHRYSIGSNPSKIRSSASAPEHPLLTVAKKNDGTWSLRPVFYASVMTKNGMATMSSNSSSMLVHPPSPALLAARLLHLLDGDTGVVRAVGVLQRAALLESRSECVMTRKGKRMLASSFEYMFRLVAIAMADIQSITTTNNHHQYDDPDVIFNQIMKVIETDARDSIAAKDFGILNPFAVVDASSPSASSNVKERLSSAVKKPTPKKKSAVKRVKIEDSSASSSDADDHDSDDEDAKQDSAIKKQKTPFSAIKSLAILASDDKNNSKNPIVNPIISSSSSNNNPDERKILKDQSEIEATIKKNFPLFADKLPSPCLTCGLFACPSSSSGVFGGRALCPLPGLKLWILPSGLVDPEEAERRARQLQLQKEREEKEAREAEQKAIAEAEKRKRKEEREAAARKAREEELERKIKEERDRKLRRERECSPHETLLLLHELMKTLRSQRAPSWWWYDSVMLILETLGFNGDGLAVFYQLPRTTNDIVEAIHFTLERSQRMENDAEFREQMEQLSQKQMASVLRTDSAVVSFFSDEQMVNILMQKEVAQVLDRVLGEVWVDKDRQMKGVNLVPIKDTVYV